MASRYHNKDNAIKELIEIEKENKSLNPFEYHWARYDIGIRRKALKTELSKSLPAFIVFDFLLDGNFDKDSGIFSMIYKTGTYKEGTSIRCALDEIGSRFTFEFDNSVNIDLLFALFSVMNYWIKDFEFLRCFTEQLKHSRSINLRDDNQFIDFLYTRTNSLHQLAELKWRNGIFDKIKDKLNENGMPNDNSETDLALLSLELLRENYILESDTEASDRSDAEKNTSLYDFFNRHIIEYKAGVHPHHPFPSLLTHKSVHSASALEGLKHKTQENITRFKELTHLKKIKPQVHAIMVEIGELKISDEMMPEELLRFKNNVKALLATRLDHITRELNITAKIVETLLCPISFELINDPVFTPYGHTYERINIERAIKKSGKCPFTRKALSLLQLIPNRIMIDQLALFSPEQRLQINSDIQSVLE